MNHPSNRPLVTVAVPCFNQGNFLDQALRSIFEQPVKAEVFVLDGGSTDSTLDVIRQWQPRLAGWRSHPDAGQAAAINEGIALGRAPFVCWLNSDDWFLPKGLARLIAHLQNEPKAPMAYGRAWNMVQSTNRRYPVWVEPFSEDRLSLRCIISQPATLIRRSSWERAAGLDSSLHMAMDYDLWWRIYRSDGLPSFLNEYIAVNRVHPMTKTNTQRVRHYREAIAVVRKHHGSVPLKWWLAQPYSIWVKAAYARLSRGR